MNRTIRKRLEKIPEHYSARIDRSLEQILGEEYPAAAQWNHGRPGRKRNRKFFPAVCGSLAAVFVCVFSFFYACPAYAAGIPVLNHIIYTISPTVKEDGAAEERAAEKLSAVLKEIMESDVLLYTGQEQTGGDWQINVDTLHAAYYFKNRIRESMDGRESENPEITIEIQTVEAERKGYEIRVQAVCHVYGEKMNSFTETIQAVLIEKPEQLIVVGMQS